MKTDAQVRLEVSSRFAGQEASVDRAFKASPAFRALCADYLTCAETLAYWQDVGSAEAAARVAEYSSLLDELTWEVERHLMANEP